MKLNELKKKIDNVLKKYPQYKDCEVVTFDGDVSSYSMDYTECEDDELPSFLLEVYKD